MAIAEIGRTVCRLSAWNWAEGKKAEEPMIVIQLSDPHILAPGELL